MLYIVYGEFSIQLIAIFSTCKISNNGKLNEKSVSIITLIN